MLKKFIVFALVICLLMNSSCAKKEEPKGESGAQAGGSSQQEEQGGQPSDQSQQSEEARLERIDAIEAMLEDPYLMLVNRDHKLSEDFEPSDPVTFEGGCPLDRTCAEQLEKLIDAGAEEGYNFILYSGYRTYTRQYNIYYNKVNNYKNQGYSEEEAINLTNRYSAPPGASEHQTGLAADVCIPSIVNQYGLDDRYGETEEFEWFSTHAHEYGFIMRYPLGKEEITGYAYEPWHYRYVGVEVAKDVYQSGLTYEEYIEELQIELETLKNAA